jgi:hypothetical protein
MNVTCKALAVTDVSLPWQKILRLHRIDLAWRCLLVNFAGWEAWRLEEVDDNASKAALCVRHKLAEDLIFLLKEEINTTQTLHCDNFRMNSLSATRFSIPNALI